MQGLNVSNMAPIYSKIDDFIMTERQRCRDNDYRHRMVYDQIMTTSFWKKDSLLALLNLRTLDMSETGALYHFYYWNKKVPVRLPADKEKARLVLLRINKRPVEIRRSNGRRIGDDSRGKREHDMLEAQALFDINVNHEVSVPQLDSILESLTNLLGSGDLQTAIFDQVTKVIVKLTLLSQIDLSSWVALSTWTTDALLSFGVSLSGILKFLQSFAVGNHDQERLQAQGLTNFQWVDFIAGFFSLGIFQKPLDLDLFRTVTAAGNFSRGISNIWQLIDKFVKDGLPVVYRLVTGKPYEISELKMWFADIELWYDEVQELISVEILDDIAVSTEKCKQIENLYRKGMSYISRADEMKLDFKMIKAIEFHFNVLKVYYDKVQASGAFKCSPRTEPLIVCIHGEPGVGKSGMMFPMAIEMLKTAGYTGKNWSEQIYTRNVNQQYWDGYRDQAICMYDDFGQKVDSASTPNEEFFEIIKTGNLAPYNLHMASIQEKSRTYFRSKAIILSSNTAFFTPKSLTHPEAVRRRIDISACVKVKPEFRKKGTDRIDPLKVMRAFPEGYSTEIYNIFMCDPMTGHLEDDAEALSYDQFIGRVQAKFDRKIRGGEMQLAFLNRLAAQGIVEEFKEGLSIPPLFALYKMGFRGFSEWDEDATIESFEAKLYDGKVSIDWKYLKECSVDPLYAAVEHPVSRLWMKGKRVLSEKTEGCLEILKDKSFQFKQLAKGFVQQCVELLNKYPLIKALAVAVPAVAALWWCFSPRTEKITTEVSKSGDFRTKARKIKTELARSGDLRTKAKTIQTEINKSGDLKTQRTKLKVEEDDSDIDFEAELQRDENAFGLSKKLFANSYIIEVLKGACRTAAMKGFFIRGRIFLTAAHLKPALKDCDAIRIYNGQKPEGFVIPIERLQMTVVTDRFGEEKDQLLIDMSRLVHEHPDILGSIATSEEMEYFTKANGVLVSADSNNTLMRFGQIKAADHRIDYQDGRNNIYHLRKHYSYDLETTKGDCGSPLVVISNQLKRKLIGMHVAGGTGIGVSTPLNGTQIAKALEKFSMDAQMVLESQDWVKELVYPGDLKMPKGDFTVLGKALYKEASPMKSKIEPSSIHGYRKPTTAPCKLGSVRVGDEIVDPMMRGLQKCAKPSQALDQRLLRAAVQSVRQNFLPDAERQRVLTNREAVEGISDDEFAAPIKRSTSAGYPLKKETGGKPGKTKWLGDGEEYFLPEEIEEIMDAREECARNNIRFPTIWVDTLKDERRPVEKVRIGKTRVFSAGPMDYILSMRKFFLGFASHCAKNRNVNEISVGTNVCSTDWETIASLMGTHGRHVIAGDFTNFDGTLHVEILHEICDIINDWYDDGEENQQIRKVLWRELLNSVHVCGETIYMWTHSQPSGNPLTAILNSVYNAIACRYVWMLVTRQTKELHSMKAFRKNIKMVSYGDDNLLNVSEDVIGIFNQITMAEAFAEFGMTYTDEAKSGKMIPSRKLEEVSYLKRKFVWDEDRMMWLCPLDLDTILEIPNWIKRSPCPEEATESNIEDALEELGMHDEDVFNANVRLIVKACQEANLNPQILTYYEYRGAVACAKGMITAFA